MSISSHSQTSERRPIKGTPAASGRAVKLSKSEAAHWASFKAVWERGATIRSFVWTQDSSDEAALFGQFLFRLRRLFRVDFCFIALRQEDGKIFQAGVPEGSLERLPVDFVRRSMELIANSRIPVRWSGPETQTDYRSMVISPLSPPVGEPLGVLMLGHCRAREFNQAELFLLQSLAGEASWAIRELRSKQSHRKLLSAASLELKNSLNAVLTECSGSQSLAPAASVTAHQQALSAIEKNAQEALRAIGSFLDSATDQQGRLSVLREPVDLVAMVNNTLNDCRARAEMSAWCLETRYADDLPSSYITDPARFRHVLREVVEYALGMARGPLLVQVRHKSDFIEINVTASGAPPVEKQAGVASAVYNHRPGDLVSARIETVRENLNLLNGHLHLTKLPGAGLEIGLCLPTGEQTRAGCGAFNFVGK